MSDYRLDIFGQPVRASDDMTIPCDMRNMDYLDYLAWVDAGNTAAPYVAPELPVAQDASQQQFLQQLVLAGMITQAEADAALTSGILPPVLANFIDGLPPRN